MKLFWVVNFDNSRNCDLCCFEVEKIFIFIMETKFSRVNMLDISCDEVEVSTVQQSREWTLIEKWKNRYDESILDDKFDPGNRLYCEGEPKPFWRGRMHYFGVLFFAISLPFLLRKCNTALQVFVVCMWVMVNILTYGFSVVFHTFPLTPPQEIFFHKLDHIFVFVNTASHVTQYIVLALPQKLYYLLVPNWIVCIWGFVMVVLKKKRDKHTPLCAVGLLLTIPFLHFELSMYGIALFWATWSLIIAGLVFYILKWPKGLPGTFGYHEFFHLNTCFAAVLCMCLEFELLDGRANCVV